MNKEILIEAKRIDGLRVYLSQGEATTRAKNMHILRKHEKMSMNDQFYRNTNPLIAPPNEANTGITQYMV